MIEIRRTAEFLRWLHGLVDQRAKERINMRLVRLEVGLFGDVKFFQGIGEIRVDHGPGYRVYFVRRGNTVVILLCGGDKSTQRQDVRRALAMAEDLRDGA